MEHAQATAILMVGAERDRRADAHSPLGAGWAMVTRRCVDDSAL